MKILYLSPTGVLGGAEKVLLSVIRGVRQACPEARLHLLSLSAGPLVERAADLGVEVSVLPLPASLESLGDSQLVRGNGRLAAGFSLLSQVVTAGPAGWRLLGEFRRQIGRIGPDLIHSNGIKTHSLAWLADGGKIPVVWHAHDFFSARPLACRLLRLASRRVAGVIAISPAVAADLKVLGLERRTHVIANGLDVGTYAPAAQDARLLDALAGLPPAPPSCLRVGHVATYARWKGQAVFLDAAAELAKTCPGLPVRFYVIGGPIYRTRGSQYTKDELLQHAGCLGIADRVGFIGFQSDVVPIYRALDVVVHASTAPEPFGLTIIEAMACGKPVIATLGGGVADIIEPGRDALGIAPANSSLLAGAMRSLLEDSSLRASLGAEARRTVCRRFNQDRIGTQVLDLYFRLTALSIETLAPKESAPALSAKPL